MREPIISQQTRIRHPETFRIGRGSIVDDFCYVSTRVQVGIGCHIAAGCHIAGGQRFLFTLGDFSSLSAGVTIWCASNDYVRDLICLAPDGPDLGDAQIEGDVTLGPYTGVGANSVIMPDTIIPEGAAVGALSFVPPHSRLEPWTVYAGVPARRIRPRDETRVRAQIARLRLD